MTKSDLNVKSIMSMSSVRQLKESMAMIFQEAQTSLMSHKKLVIVLKHIFERAIELDYSEYFGLLLSKLINRVLPLKKGDQNGDRIIKFVASFIRIINTDELKKKEKNVENSIRSNTRDDIEDDDSEEEEEESYSDQLLKYLITHLLRGIESKDKNVRFRVVQSLAYLVNQILEIDYDTYRLLYLSLSRRLNDKEPSIRIQAIIALSKFQVYEFDQDDENDEQDEIPISREFITKNMVSAIRFDESAEVRRAALINLTRSDKTLMYLLERVGDVNSINRRLIYSRVMKELGDFRKLNFASRTRLLKCGLNDRDSSVRTVAIKMLTEDWFKTVDENLNSLIKELRPIDNEVAEDAMMEFFKYKPELASKLHLEESQWDNLSSEHAFLLHIFHKFASEINQYEIIDANYPEPVTLAENLKVYLDRRTMFLRDNTDISSRYEKHMKRVSDMENDAFPIQTEMFKLKGDLDHNYRNLRKAENALETLKYQITLYKKRIKDLGNGEETRLSLKTVRDRQPTEEEVFLSLSPRELRTYIKENEEDIESLTSSVETYELNITNAHEAFYGLEETFGEISLRRENEFQEFNEQNQDYEPFRKELENIQYIIQQLLLLANNYDFSDEIGRRRMLQIVRFSLMDDNLPDQLMESTLKLLRKISISERDFTSMCTEIINDLRDSFDHEEDSFHSAISGFDDAQHEDSYRDNAHGKRSTSEIPDEVTIRCLVILQHVLELVEKPLDHNLSLSSLRFNLINVAIAQVEKARIYTLGLTCLGLYSLIDRDSVFDSIKLFNMKLRESTEEIRIIAMKAIVDILANYGPLVVSEKILLYSIARNFHKNLNQFEMPKIQRVVAEGVSKLFLADIFNDSLTPDEGNEELESTKQLFESLILSNFHPLTSNNNELRQILAFCIPVYAFSHINHQIRLASISGDCVFRMFLDDSEFMRYENRPSPGMVVQQLIEWCDPRNVVNVTMEELDKSPAHVFQSLSLLQAVEQETSKTVKKAILNNLSKIYVSENLNSKILEGLFNGLEDTRACLENNKNSPEFSFDRSTMKAFDNFYNTVHKALLHATKMSELDEEGRRSSKQSSQHSSRRPSASSSRVSSVNSIPSSKNEMNGKDSQGLDATYTNDDNGNKDHMNKGKSEDSVTEDVMNISKNKVANLGHEKKSVSQINIDNSLHDIDQMLANADEEEYDIPMSDSE